MPETITPPTAPPEFRRADEVSWRTTLILRPDVYDMMVQGDSPQSVQERIAETALVFGYQFVTITPKVYEVKPPESGAPPRLLLTELLVENGDFVRYVVTKGLTPLCANGQPVFFVNPEMARGEALRNGAEVRRADEWAKAASEAARSKIIQATSLPPSLITARR